MLQKSFLDSLKIPIKTYVYNHFSYIRGVDWGGGGDTKPRMRGRKWKISEVRSTWLYDIHSFTLMGCPTFK